MPDFTEWFPLSQNTVVPAGTYDLKFNDANGAYLTEMRVNVTEDRTVRNLDQVMSENMDQMVFTVSAKKAPRPEDEVRVVLNVKDYEFLIGMATIGANQGKRAHRILNNKILFRIISTTRAVG
jgi:hypothetical protein